MFKVKTKRKAQISSNDVAEILIKKLIPATDDRIEIMKILLTFKRGFNSPMVMAELKQNNICVSRARLDKELEKLLLRGIVKRVKRELVDGKHPTKCVSTLYPFEVTDHRYCSLFYSEVPLGHG